MTSTIVLGGLIEPVADSLLPQADTNDWYEIEENDSYAINYVENRGYKSFFNLCKLLNMDVTQFRREMVKGQYEMKKRVEQKREHDDLSDVYKVLDDTDSFVNENDFNMDSYKDAMLY